MALLVPLFLLGLAGVVVPIVLHLTRRQRRNVVQFPSLMFLERIPYQEQRRRRIHYWFLLSLRALALALVAIAFARPFFEQDMRVDTTEAEGADGRATGRRSFSGLPGFGFDLNPKGSARQVDPGGRLFKVCRGGKNSFLDGRSVQDLCIVTGAAGEAQATA